MCAHPFRYTISYLYAHVVYSIQYIMILCENQTKSKFMKFEKTNQMGLSIFYKYVRLQLASV